MKNIVLIAGIICLIPFCSNAQTNLKVKTADGKSTGYQEYFDSIHKAKTIPAPAITKSSQAFVAVSFGDDSKIKAIEIQNVPDVTWEPEAEKYVKSMLYSVGSNWDLTSLNPFSPGSDIKVMFFISVMKYDQDLKEKALESSKASEFGVLELEKYPIYKGIAPMSELGLSFGF